MNNFLNAHWVCCIINCFKKTETPAAGVNGSSSNLNYMQRTRNLNRTWAVVNIIVHLVVIVVNYLAVTLPLNNRTTGALAALYPNLFTPAGFAFSIWSVIYLFVTVFVVYQARQLFCGGSQIEVLRIISPVFVVLCLANAGWLFAWHYQMVGLSVIIMLIMLGSLLVIHTKLGLAKPWRGTEKWCLDVPFSLYLGWISVATIANITAFLVHNGLQPPGISEVGCTVIMVLVAALIGIYMIAVKRNVVFAWVVCWALLAIYVKRKQEVDGDEAVIYVSIGAAVILFLCSLWSIVSHRSRTMWLCTG